MQEQKRPLLFKQHSAEQSLGVWNTLVPLGTLTLVLVLVTVGQYGLLLLSYILTMRRPEYGMIWMRITAIYL